MCISTIRARLAAATARLSRIVAEGRDIVDDIDALGEGRAHHGGMARVDGEQQPGMLAAPSGEALEDRLDAADLGRRIDSGRTRPGRFPADVQDRGPGTGVIQREGHGGLGVEMLATVGKAVGRHIDDAHEDGGFACPGRGPAQQIEARRSGAR